jgi:hypothetical protein
MAYTIETISTATGAQSLIGVHGEAPHSWANYFWLQDGGKVINFWLENLEAADLKFELDGKVRVRNYTTSNGKYTFIDDERIPKEWYYNKLHQAGALSIEDLTELYEYVGDPDNELEQYTDPKSYHEKRGQTYKEYTLPDGTKSAIISYNVTAKEDIKLATFKSKISEDSGFFYAPYVPKIPADFGIIEIQPGTTTYGLDVEEELTKILMKDIEGSRND